MAMAMTADREIHIVGIVGLPARYGGFETLVDQLLDSKNLKARKVVVYCESWILDKYGSNYKNAVLRALSWKANGWQSILFDAHGIFKASREGACVLILGTSATLFLPIFRRLFPSARYIVNMAGLEWSRSKWGVLARSILKFNELCAAKFADTFIADNQGLVDYVRNRYGRRASLIAYGGDQHHKLTQDDSIFGEFSLPATFDFAMARAQSDNQLALILETYSTSKYNLVFVSNWSSSVFGKNLYKTYNSFSNLFLLHPIYDSAKIKSLHSRTRLYIHGHSAGGTNPVLVEAMWSGLATAAYDVVFNRHTTCEAGFYFENHKQLMKIISDLPLSEIEKSRERLLEIARKEYSWDKIRSDYEEILLGY